MSHKPALIVHGGAWEIPDPEVSDHLKGIEAAVSRGWDVLSHGGSALDAVEETIALLEDDPTFDAGKGSILNTDGSIEMDASIMDGRAFDAGAVAALRNFPNPIRVARRVLEKTDHILLVGVGAEDFARKEGFISAPIEDLLTPRELKRLEALIMDKQFIAPYAFGKKRGTVGAVALDSDGHLAAGTSTGGTPKKIPGRVGDSPLIGCGTYAEDGVCGVSCTGWGEAIMKVMLARDIAERMRSGLGAQEAAKQGIDRLGIRADGLGGVIVMDALGNMGVSFNTPRMARGFMRDGLDQPIVTVE